MVPVSHSIKSDKSVNDVSVRISPEDCGGKRFKDVAISSAAGNYQQMRVLYEEDIATL